MFRQQLHQITVITIGIHLAVGASAAETNRHRVDLGKITFDNPENLEYLTESHKSEQFAYLEAVDYGGCPDFQDIARTAVGKVVSEETQERKVRQFEIGCRSESDGSTIVTALQTYTGTNVSHMLFVYRIDPAESFPAATKLCSLPEYSYGLGDVELSVSTGEASLVLFFSHASTGETSLTVFDLACNEVLMADVIKYRVVADSTSRGVITLERTVPDGGGCAHLIRRLVQEDEVIATEQCDDKAEPRATSERFKGMYRNTGIHAVQ